MGNRILKESICTNARLARVSIFGELLFYHLIVSCDDFGRFLADARTIRGIAFCRRDDVELDMIEAALDELEAQGLIVRYRVKEVCYFYMPGWEEHQKLRFRKEKYPKPTACEEQGGVPPTEVATEETLVTVQNADLEATETLTEEATKTLTEEATKTVTEEATKTLTEEAKALRDRTTQVCREATHAPAYIDNNIITYTGREEKSKRSEAEGKKSEKKTRREGSLNPPHNPPEGDREEGAISLDFERFWDAYPRKECREKAKQAFFILAPQKPLLEKMLEALARFKRCDQWNRDGGRYVPHPSNWLLERRWEESEGLCDENSRGSFDADSFFEAALAHSRRALACEGEA